VTRTRMSLSDLFSRFGGENCVVYLRKGYFQKHYQVFYHNTRRMDTGKSTCQCIHHRLLDLLESFTPKQQI
jgi:hypothetical protein